MLSMDAVVQCSMALYTGTHPTLPDAQVLYDHVIDQIDMTRMRMGVVNYSQYCGLPLDWEVRVPYTPSNDVDWVSVLRFLYEIRDMLPPVEPD